MSKPFMKLAPGTSYKNQTPQTSLDYNSDRHLGLCSVEHFSTVYTILVGHSSVTSVLVMLIYTVLWISLHFRDFDTILGAKRLLRQNVRDCNPLTYVSFFSAQRLIKDHKTSLKGRICRFGLYNSAWACCQSAPAFAASAASRLAFSCRA